jgi:hypothetical protein
MLRMHWKLDKNAVRTLWEHIGNKKKSTPRPPSKEKRGPRFFFLLTQIITGKKVKIFKIFIPKRTEFCEGK